MVPIRDSVGALSHGLSTEPIEGRIPWSLSEKGCPLDDAAGESTNKSLKAEMVWGDEFADLHELQVRINDYVWWHDDERLHSTLNYTSPVEFRLAGMSL